MFGTLLPGMFFSMPGISNSSHSSFFMNQQPIKMAFAQEEEYKKMIDNDKHEYIKDDPYYDQYSDVEYGKTVDRQLVEIERFDDKLFVCDNGIVVDDRTQCPLKCPFGTTLRWSICYGS